MREMFFVLLVACLLSTACAGPGRPDWVDGVASTYPPQAYVVGVGRGIERGVAEDRARAEIAKTFEVDVYSRDEIRESQVGSASDAAAVQRELSVRNEVLATSRKLLQGVKVVETWRDPEGGGYHALAVLDRSGTARSLRQDLEALDTTIGWLLTSAESEASPLLRFGRYRKALAELERRQDLAADLRVLSSAEGVFAPVVDSGSLARRAEETARSIHVGIELEGDTEGIVEGALIRALAGLGMQVTPSFDRTHLIRGSVSVQHHTKQPPWIWSLARVQLEILEDDRSLDVISAEVKEASVVEGRSAVLARQRLGQRLAQILEERLGGAAP